MPEEKPKPQKQPETIAPLEQKEAPAAMPGITTEQLQEYSNQTKEAGNKSASNAQIKLDHLKDQPSAKTEQ